MENQNSEDDSDHSQFPYILIRKARVSDVDDIARIYKDSIEHLDIESREWIEGIIRKRSKRVRIYVATQDDKVIGFILVYKKRDRAYIDAFAVDVAYRGRGIGEYLLEYVERMLIAEGIEKIYLTVKNNNHKALGIYIKNGYRISNTVLLLEALIVDINDYIEKQDSIMIKINSVKRGMLSKAKLLDIAIWSNFTWDVDDAIYRISSEEAVTITVYKDKRLLGIARICIYQNKVIVERLALSFYRPTESLKTIINAIKIKLAQQPKKIVAIPVDSTKSSLLRTLISMGFRVTNSEYVLYKELILKQPQQKTTMIKRQLAIYKNQASLTSYHKSA